MNRTNTIALTGGIGALAALLLALPGLLPPAMADSEPLHTVINQTLSDVMPVPLDPNDLVRWDFKAEPGVSTEPLGQSQVRKIAYGHTTFVNVVETSSGVYSSDAITDPHVRYPGIHVTPKPYETFGELWVWGGGSWAMHVPFGAHSFVSVIPYKGGRLVTTNEGQCAITPKLVSC